MPAQRHRGAVLMMYMQQYHDQLLEDMRINPHRKVRSRRCWCFCLERVSVLGHQASPVPLHAALLMANHRAQAFVLPLDCA